MSDMNEGAGPPPRGRRTKAAAAAAAPSTAPTGAGVRPPPSAGGTGGDAGRQEPAELSDVVRAIDDLALRPGIASGRRSLDPSSLVETDAVALYSAIRIHTDLISFPFYDRFINRLLCQANPQLWEAVGETGELGRDRLRENRPRISDVDLYRFLKFATDAFLLVNGGAWEPTARPVDLDVPAGSDLQRGNLPDGVFGDRNGRDGDGDRARLMVDARVTDDFPYNELHDRLNDYLGGGDNNYLELVLQGLALERGGRDGADSPFCPGYLSPDGPYLLELIWSYWQEEGMLAQTVNAITLRFQNVRRRGRDPLGDLMLDPLRPLAGILWGYVQDETNRLSLVRRAYEYNHEYGITLYGRAVPRLRPADPRSRFLQGFHNLLRACARFYREDNDTTVRAEAFGVLNALKEVHLLLSEGAHNQFRSLPWQARAEMLLQQWLLSRAELREFLRGRPMVAYQEAWMGRVDAMKALQGWNTTSVMHFNDLARFGERLLLSIRYGSWSRVTDQEEARTWARYWKPEVQGYIHAYQTVTGVDLAADTVAVGRADARYLPPSHHLRLRERERTAIPASW